MKKIFGIITLLSYLFSTSILAHADMMGFLSDHQMGNTMNSNVIESISSVDSYDYNYNNQHKFKQDKSHKMQCCDFSNANQISQSEIKSKDITKFLPLVQPIDSFINIPINYNYINLHKSYLAFSPGWNTRIKYQKFSDLVGIIVNII